MRIAVVGLGGVGGYLAASLACTAHEVVGFARGAHLEAIQKNGISVVEDTKTWHATCQAQELKNPSGVFDLVLFCVKGYDLLPSLEALRHAITPDTILLSFANGIENGELLRQNTHAKVLDGCVYILSHIEKAGVIRKKGEVFAAVFGGDKEATHKVAELFKEAHLRYKTPENIQEAIWKKYIFIAAFATLTSTYDAPIGAIYKEHYDEAKALLEEIAAVAHAKGIEIADEVQKALDTASKVPYDSSTSMHLDFQNNKPTEVETLSGTIVREGVKYGIKTPLMQKFYEKLRG
ncbi:MAG: ketopantoate reductase family protein [Sulfurimonadaceae bacterium]